MSRNYSNTYRPSPSYKNNRYQTSSSNYNNRKPGPPPSFWHTQDDQIAPKHTSTSVDNLQRWALATANFSQQGLGKNEAMIEERIERRYGSGSRNQMPRHSNLENKVEEEHEESEGWAIRGCAEDGNKDKRARDISFEEMKEEGRNGRELSAAAVMNLSKRRRVERKSGEDGDGVIDLTGDYGVIDLTQG